MSFEKNISREKQTTEYSLKTLLFSREKLTNLRVCVCVMTDEKNSLHGVRFAHDCRINGVFIRECRANVMFHVVRKINFEG